METITVYSPAELKEFKSMIEELYSNGMTDVAKQCKGVTSHELRKKYPFLKKLPSLWTRSYFVATDEGKGKE